MILGNMGVIRSRTFINTNAFEYAEVGIFQRAFSPVMLLCPWETPEKQDGWYDSHLRDFRIEILPGLLLVRSMIERRTQDFYLGSTLMTRSTGIYLHRYIHTYTEMYLCEFFCQTKHPVSCTWWPHSCLVCRYIPIAWRNVWPIEALSKSLLSKSSRPSSYMTSAFATLVPPIPLIKYQQIPGPGKILKTPFSCL